MRTAGGRGRSRIALSFGVLAMVVGLMSTVQPSTAQALQQHGVGFFKGCTSPTDVLQKTSCNFTITNSVDPDTLTITSLVDIVHAAGGDDNAGNILPQLQLSFSGGASCNGTQTQCTLPPGSKISTDPTAIGNSGTPKPFVFHIVTGQDADNANPLKDDAKLTWTDTCSSGAPNCPIGAQLASTGSQTLIRKLPSGVDTQIHDPQHQVVTAIEAGTTVHDFVTVSGAAGAPTPTGVVNVDWFTNGDCSGTPAANSGDVGLTSGSVDVTAFTQTPAAGHYGFLAHYKGDSIFQPGDGSCEPLVVVDASISIAPSATNEVNHTHTFTVTVKKNLGDGFVAASGVSVTYTLTDSNGAVHVTSPNPPTTCDGVTDGNGQCDIVFTSASGGKVVGNAKVTMLLQGVTVTRDTDPSTTNIPSGPNGSGPATKTFVDANISIKPNATNEVGKAHTFTVTVKQNNGSGNGFVTVPNGIKPTVTLTATNGASVQIQSNTCSSTGTVAGKCTVTFVSPTAGQVVGNASVNLTIGGVSLSRDTDTTTPATSGPGGSGPATKTYVDLQIALSPLTATNEVGQPHTVTVTVKQNLGKGAGFVAVPKGTIPTLTLTNSNGAGFQVTANTCSSVGTVSGKCTVTFTSPTAGQVTINASVTLTVGGVTMTRDTDPTTVNVGAGPNGTGPANKTFVDASIALSPLNATNEVGKPHTVTVTVQQNNGSGNGFVNGPDGTKPTVTLTNSNGAAFQISNNTCTNPGTSNGTCSVTFTSPSAGTVTVNASVTLTIGGVTLTRDSDPATGNVPAGPGGTGPATKVFVDASIAIAPSATNEVGKPHTFTVTVNQNLGQGGGLVAAPDGTKPVVTLTDSSGASHVTQTDTCANPGTSGGTCTVTFSSSSAGQVTGNASVTLTVGGQLLVRDTDPATATVGSGPGGSGPAVKTYVDASIALSPATATNEVNAPHTITVTVKQNLGQGAGLVAAPNGTKPTVSLTNSNGASAQISLNTCSNPGTTNGTCAVTFTSASAGTVTANATVTLTVGGVSLTRDSDPATSNVPAGPGGSGPATKVFVDASIAITPSATNEVGQSHTFTVTVKQNAGQGAGLVAVPNGTKPTVTLTDANGASHQTTSDTCANPGTNNGTCAVTFTSPSNGTVTGNASVTLTVGTVTLTRDTDPATTTIGSGPGGSGPAVKTFVDANITIAPDATNEVGAPHTFTVTVKQSNGSGNGFVNVPDGTKPAVTLSNSNGATNQIATNTCANPGTVNGQCSVTFTSPTAGKVTGNASVTLTIGGVTLTRDTDPATSTIGSGPGGSAPAVKTFVDASIALSPLTATNEVGKPHTVTVTVKRNNGNGAGFTAAADGTKPTVSLTNANGSNAQITTNTCANPGTSNGTCTVTFTSASAGQVTINASVTMTINGVTMTRDTDPTTVNVGSGPNGTGPATKTFVDASIGITPDATNEVGQPHTFTVTVKQNTGGGAGFVNAPDGTKPTVTLTSANGANAQITINTCANPGTSNGTCSVTFSSTTNGTVTGNAYVTLTVGGQSLTRDTDPQTVSGSGPGGTGPAVKTFVDANITITPDATNEVGKPHTFSVTVKQSNGSGNGFVAAPNGTKPTVSLANSNGASNQITNNTCSTTGTVNGVCSVTFSSATAGQVTGNASVTFTVGGVILTRDTDPATATTAGPNGSGPATKTYVDANIAISPPSATNEVNGPHTITITVQQNSGNGGGFVAAPNGTKPTVNLTSTNGANAQITTNTCANPGTANGQCTVTFSSPTAGTVTANASVTFSVGGVSLTRDTDPATTTVPAGPNGSGPATKVFVDANITITPSATNEVGKPHTFTVTAQQNAGGGAGFVAVPNGTKPVVTLVDSNGAGNQVTTNTCSTTGTVSGSCSVTFTSPTAGKVTGNASVTITVGGVTLTRDTDPSSATIGAGPGGSGPAVKTFVDANITITPPTATNEVGQPHTFVVSVKQNAGDGAGFVNVANGTHPAVSLTNANGANNQISSNTCSTTGTTNGTCSVTFTSASAGQVTGNASVTITVGGVTLTRDTDPSTVNVGSGPNGSGPALKTFVDANITITPNATNEVGDDHTFTVTVQQNAGAGAGFVSPADGTKVTVVLTDSNGASHQTSSDTCANPGTTNGQCSVTFTSPSNGTVTGNAYVTLTVGGVTLNRDTDPATTTVGSGPGGSGPAVKTFVDAFITITPSATNEVGQPHTFIVTVKQSNGSGNGFVNAPNGTKPVVALANSLGASNQISSNTCANPGTVGGICSVTFTSPTAGKVTGNASVTLTVGGVSLTRDTDPATATTAGPGGSGPAVKTFVDANITITPDATNEVGQPHTFTVTVKRNLGNGGGFVNAPDGTAVTVTLTDGNGATHQTSADTCASPGTVNGQCSVTFTSSNNGTVTGNAYVTFTVGGVSLTRDTDPQTVAGAGPNGSGPAVKTFVDANITLSPLTATNEVGKPHTVVVTVKQNNGSGAGFVAAPNGTKPVVTLADTNGAVSQLSSDTCANPGTVNGTCSVTFTSNSAGKVTVNATVTFTVSGVSLTRDTDPQTTTTAGPGGSGPATKTFVDANITIAPNATNEVGQSHTFVVTVKRDQGNGLGLVNVPDGTKPAVTLTDSNGAANVPSSNTCANPGTVNGQCSVTFTSASAGKVTGNASVTLTVGGVSLTRDTDPQTTPTAGPGGSGSAVKTFVDASIGVTPDATNEVGQPHTFTVVVKQNTGGGAGFVNPPDNTKVTVTLTDANGAASQVTTDTCANPGTSSGTCTVTFTSPNSGTVTANASVTLPVGGVTLTRDTNPATATIPSGPGGTGPAVKTFVDANITITPSATNEVGQPHTFVVTVKQSSGNGNGFVNAPNGTKPTVTLTDSNGAANVPSSNTCANPGTSNGTCSVTFTSASAGKVTGNASVTLTVGGVSLTRDTNPATANVPAGPNGSGPAVKTFVDANITITPPTATNEVNDDHTFTVTVKRDLGTGSGLVNVPDGTKPTVTLTDSNGASHTLSGTGDTCNTAGTVNGQCTVTFTSASAGQVTGNASVTLNVGGVTLTRDTNPATANVPAGPNGSGPAVKTFVDASIKITPPNATNETGDDHTFTVTVKRDLGDGAGLVNAPNGTIVTVTLTDSNGASHTLSGTGDTCASPGTSGGTCTVTFTSNSVGEVTGNASVTLSVGGVSLTRDTDPATTTIGSGPGGSGPAVKTFVTANISITPTATNEVGQPHTFIITVQQDTGDGNGLVDAPDGTKPTVTLTDSNGAANVPSNNTCSTTGTVGGDCSVTFTSATAGKVTGNATVTFTVSGVSLTRDTDPATANVSSGPGGSGPAVKTFVDANITITPADATNPINAPHTMTITVMRNNGSGNGFVPAQGGHATFTLTDANGANGSTHVNTASSTCDNAGANLDANGQCTIVFTSTAPGTTTGNGFVTLSIGGVSVTRDTDPATVTTAGPNGSGPAVKHWFNPVCTLGYPDSSHTPRSSVIFNESEVLRSFALFGTGSSQRVALFYNDEHALTLGTSQVTIKTAGGTTTNNYPVTAMTQNPDHAANAQTGATIAQGGVDAAAGGGRPVFPGLFVTDITNNPSDRSGDWQQGSNNANSPTDVYGTWKANTVVIDKTQNPQSVTFTVGNDPAKNHYTLGAGADPVPSGLTDQGYGAEVVWSAAGLGLQSGHVYRLLFMVHDGDQNNGGGDVGEACVNMYIP